MFLQAGWRSLLDGAERGEELDRVRARVDRLQPAAAQALLASLRRKMAARVHDALTEVLEGQEDRGLA